MSGRDRDGTHESRTSLYIIQPPTGKFCPGNGARYAYGRSSLSPPPPFFRSFESFESLNFESVGKLTECDDCVQRKSRELSSFLDIFCHTLPWLRRGFVEKDRAVWQRGDRFLLKQARQAMSLLLFFSDCFGSFLLSLHIQFIHIMLGSNVRLIASGRRQ